MNALIIHIYSKVVAGRQEQVLSIFVANHNVTLEEFDEAVVNAITAATVTVDTVHIVGYQQDVHRVRQWVREEGSALRGRFENLVGVIETGVRFILFDETQGRHVDEDVAERRRDESEVLLMEQQAVLLAAFRAGGGEQRAPTGTHYVKTSDSHAERFLRVSNVLEDGANVCLLAYWLAGYLWSAPIRYVVVDTSGIFSVAQKLIYEVAIRGGLAGQPLVWSHRSHDGVDEIAEHHAREALFLISASTSGGLAQRLIRQGALPDRLVTLFFLSDSNCEAGRVLCNLRGTERQGLQAIRNYQEADCPYCKKHYHRIQIQGDQFAIAPPNVSSVEIKAADLPGELKPTLSALLGLRVFSAFRRHEGDRIASIAANVGPILSGPLTEKNRGFLTQKREEWVSLVRRSSSVSSRHIVACSYPQSTEIAEAIAQTMRPLLRDNGRPRVLSADELRSAIPEAGTSTVVVSACIDEGKELLAVSRTLRDVQENGSTTYLAALHMICPKTEADRLRSNLTFGQHGPATFSMHCLISLPLNCYEEEVSWAKELQELLRIQSFADRNDLAVPARLEARISRLQEAPGEGLIDDIFWPAASGQPLALRSDFSLLTDARHPPAATQADLYVVVSLLLSQLRMSSDAARRLSYNAYERSIISPDNFDRFNDGVLQACLLRAARPKELSYGACDISLSERMLSVLLHSVPGEQISERSESLMEFLVALATERLTLHRVHLLEFCNRIVAAAASEDSAVLVAQYIIGRENPDGGLVLRPDFTASAGGLAAPEILPAEVDSVQYVAGQLDMLGTSTEDSE
ncbi:hypothetical protein KTE69_10740 [Burkholderia multivorans]|uniref:Uncharacterized protein n=1 Tax=Burkholderia multivorans TaxID=87883 RepID=A0AAP2MSI5_9BURK|nr:hypothetical protein [Burkholderia multivorans]MBU9360213.1 hypothetical protein [Burkholderia multivorans]MBU9368857.1 hypothetical protein [Burkholderia multivorans]HDR9017868.1 hypothetical protein [Burkholderia vietnamiensis]